MNTDLHQKIIDRCYPEWHHKPFYLTVGEINNPLMVLNNFFLFYRLPEARFCLREMLLNAMRGGETPSGDYLAMHDDLVKLLEAAFLLHEQQSTKGKKKKKRTAR